MDDFSREFLFSLGLARLASSFSCCTSVSYPFFAPAIAVRALSVVGLSVGTNEMAVLLFVLAMVILVPLVGFCDKRLGFLFGKGRAKKA